jgi:hypothetical protein
LQRWRGNTAVGCASGPFDRLHDRDFDQGVRHRDEVEEEIGADGFDATRLDRETRRASTYTPRSKLRYGITNPEKPVGFSANC